MNKVITARELEIGDVVRFDMESDMKWSQMVVKNIKENGTRVLVRPFVLIGDFVSTPGVSVTTDMETVEVHATSTIPFVLIHREDPEKYRKIVSAGKQEVIRLILAGRSADAIQTLNGLI